MGYNNEEFGHLLKWLDRMRDKEMEKNERIYIPPKRGRLPWPYDPLLTNKQQWRVISIGLTILALICAGAYVVLK